MRRYFLFISFLIIASSSLFGQALPRSGRMDKLAQDTTLSRANSYVDAESSYRFKKSIFMDSTATPSAFGAGTGVAKLVSKGETGFVWLTPSGTVLTFSASVTGTPLVASDSLLIRNYSNSLYLKNADSTSIRNYSNTLYLKNADSTSIRNYSTTLYKGASDSTAGTGYFTVNKAALKAPTASPTFTGTVTLPTGLTGTVRATSGVVSATASDTVGLATALAGKISTSTVDSAFAKGIEYTSVSAADSDIFFRVPVSGLTVSSIYVIVQGGTSATVNIGRIRVTTAADLVNANTTVNASAFTTDGTSLSTLQNTSLLIGDRIYATIRSESGTPTKVLFQVNFVKTGL